MAEFINILAELYKLFLTESSTWSKVTTEGTAPSARDKHGAAVIGETIYFFGGVGPQAAADVSKHLDTVAAFYMY